MSHWKYSLSSASSALSTAPILLTGPVPLNLSRAAKLGYQAIEIHTRPDAEIDFDAAKAVCDETGVRVSAIVTGLLNAESGCSLISPTPYIAAAAEDGMRQYIDMAARLDADVIVGWIKGRLPADGDQTEHLNRLVRVLHRLEEYAAKKSLRLHIEVVNRYETNFLNTAESMLEFIESNHLDNCYVHLDTFHMGIEESDPAKAIRLCGNRLGYVHVADNTRTYPGSGRFDFPNFLKALSEIDYRGYVSVECLPKPCEKVAAQRALSYLMDIERQLK